jgi:hypothetical protein
MSLTWGLASHHRMQGVIRSAFALRIRAYAPSLQLQSMMEYRAVQSGDHAAAAFAAAAGVSRWASQLGAIYGNFILSSLIWSGGVAHQLSGLQSAWNPNIWGVICLSGSYEEPVIYALSEAHSASPQRCMPHTVRLSGCRTTLLIRYGRPRKVQRYWPLSATGSGAAPSAAACVKSPAVYALTDAAGCVSDTVTIFGWACCSPPVLWRSVVLGLCSDLLQPLPQVRRQRLRPRALRHVDQALPKARRRDAAPLADEPLDEVQVVEARGNEQERPAVAVAPLVRRDVELLEAVHVALCSGGHGRELEVVPEAVFREAWVCVVDAGVAHRQEEGVHVALVLPHLLRFVLHHARRCCRTCIERTVAYKATVPDMACQVSRYH